MATMKYWLAGGSTAVVVIILLPFSLVFFDTIFDWQEIYRYGEFYCFDFEQSGYPCSFAQYLGQEFAQIVKYILGLPMLAASYLLGIYEISIDPNANTYLSILNFIILPLTIYFSIGALIGFIVSKFKKKK